MKKARVLLINKEMTSILFIKRVKDDNEYYVLPGGHIENEESYEACARREVLEELAFVVDELEELYDEDNTRYYYSYITELLTFEICGKEMERQTKENSYHPLWLKYWELDKYNIVPKSLLTKIKDYLFY